MLETLIKVIAFGIFGIAGLFACLVGVFYAFRTLLLLPWLLAIVWFLFFIGLPIYLAVTHERYFWLTTALISWPAAFLPWQLFAYIEEKCPEFAKEWSDMI